MDKWINVFYSDKGVKENYRFPKIRNNDNEYFSAVLNFIDILIEDLKDNNIDRDFIEISENYRTIIEEVLKKYYSGEIIAAYNKIEQLIKEYQNI